MTERTYKVILNAEAAAMLRDHIAFLARVNISAARTLRNDLLHKINGLKWMPYKYPVFYTDVSETEYRKLLYKRYLILYAIDEAEKTVRVEFVWDTRQNNKLLDTDF